MKKALSLVLFTVLFSAAMVHAQAPVAPTLLTPANAATGVVTTPTLTWSTVSAALTYGVQVSTVATFATTVVNDSSLSAASLTITTALANGRAYYWRANAANASGTSAWSAANTFTTIPAAPATPTLLTPANAAFNISPTPTFTWNTVANATSYRVQVASVATFATITFEDSTLTAATATLTTPLNAPATYYWRVSAKGPGGTGAFSASFYFTTTLGPAAPALLTPTTGALGLGPLPTLTWTTVTGASTYRLQVSTSAAFTAAGVLFNDSILTTGSITLTTPLAVPGTYYWRVNATNALGAGPWSGTNSFSTGAPAVPALLTPANNAVNVSTLPTLVWNTVLNATSYGVQVSAVSTFATLLVSDTALTAATVTLTTPLSTQSTYYWRANAVGIAGTSAWSGAFTFTTGGPFAPTSLTPANGATNVSTTPTLTWTTMAGATAYRVQVSTSNTFALLALNDSTVTAGSRALTTALAANTAYYWRVNASNTLGTSAWSAINGFTTVIAPPAAPTLNSPANAAANLSTLPTLAWNTSATATSYRVQVSANATFTNLVLNDSSETGLSATLTNQLVTLTTYYWRVNASNIGGASAFSAARTFTTAPVATPALSAPANNATGVSALPTFTWSAVTGTGAVSYRLQVSTNATFTAAGIVVNDSMITATSLLLTAQLAAGTTYYWRVEASTATATGAWSQVFSFQTVPTGIVPHTLQLAGASAALPGKAEIYRVNGARVMEIPCGLSSATKEQVARSAEKVLPKGFYIYRLRSDSKVVEQGSILVK